MSWLDGFKDLFAKADTRAEQAALAAALTETLQRAVDSATRFDELLLKVLHEQNPDTARDRHWSILFLLNERTPLGDHGQQSWRIAAERLLKDLPKLY